MTTAPVLADGAADGVRSGLADPPRSAGLGIRGAHVLAIVAIALGAVALRATEVYTTRYQTLPVLDWLNSRPPLVESANLPTADELARGLPRVMPLLTISTDAHTRLVMYGPPASVQRTLGGVRDASEIVMSSPGEVAPNQSPITLRFDVTVFGRTQQAAAWADLLARAMDIRDPDNGLDQLRVASLDDPDRVWVAAPGPSVDPIATVSGNRGPVGFELQVRLRRAGGPPDDPAQFVDMTARAEALARQAAHDWTAWLDSVAS